MPRADLVRREFSLLREDAELLDRIADQRGCSVAELIREALYAHHTPLGNRRKDRDAKAYDLVKTDRDLAVWRGERL